MTVKASSPQPLLPQRVPRLIRPANLVVQSGRVDSRRWDAYRPRADDIIIGTYPKCGTTWTQRIVGMLIFQAPDAFNITQVSPWIDLSRDGMPGPVEIEAQTHRRFLKTHLPLDAVPLYEGIKYIHVARDGRDAVMSLHNHLRHYRPDFRQRFDRNPPAAGGRQPDAPANDSAVEPVAEDPADFFAAWVATGGSRSRNPGESFFNTISSYWALREEPTMLLVHYNDLKADLGGEMRRIAAYLDISIDEDLWPALIAAARFETMKAMGDQLVPVAAQIWDRGAARFFNEGTNDRWRDRFKARDLARYDDLVARHFTEEQARWVGHGRLGKGRLGT